MTNIVNTNTETCLSPNVKKYFDVSFPIDKSVINPSYFDMDVLKINFDNILLNLGDSSDEDCLASLIQIIQIIHFDFKKYLDGSLDAQDRIREGTRWTSQPAHVQIISKLHHRDITNNSNDSGILNLLVLTSVLERSLGNVLLSSGKVKHVPALLRDLLCEKELEEILGSSCIKVMKLLVGSPKTLNIRNIAWHGFIFPGEIHPMFVTMILLLLTSISGHVQLSVIRSNERSLISDWRLGNLIEFPRESPTGHFKIQEIEKMMTESEILFKRNIPPFLRIYSLMTGGQSGIAIVLLLPMLETMMRCLFVQENKCAARLLTAETGALYTTFTEMLAPNTEDGQPNKLLSVLGGPLLELVFDLLVLPEGPRIRDKISHGELNINLDSVNSGQESALANILMAVCLTLLQKSRSFSDSKLFRFFFNEYKPLYHPSSKLKTSIMKIIRDLDRLKLEKFNGILNTETEIHEIVSKESIPGKHDKFEMRVHQEEFIHLVECHTPQTLFRPREEYELLQILTRLTENILMAIARSHENMEEKYSLLMKKELRSRQRKTLQRALKVLPEMKFMFNQLCCNIFLLLENIAHLSSSNSFKSLIGLLKKILKSCENVASNVSLQKNRWEEVVQIIVSVNESLPLLENIVFSTKS